MLDLGTFKKPQPAIHPVRQTGIEQCGFHHPTLSVAAVQQRNFFALGTVTHELLDLIDKPLRLGKITGRFMYPHGLARPSLSAQVFAQAFGIVANQRVS